MNKERQAGNGRTLTVFVRADGRLCLFSPGGPTQPHRHGNIINRKKKGTSKGNLVIPPPPLPHAFVSLSFPPSNARPR